MAGRVEASRGKVMAEREEVFIQVSTVILPLDVGLHVFRVALKSSRPP